MVTNYRLADNGTRFVALVIDSILVGIIGGIFGANDLWFLGGIIGFLVGVGYQWVFLTRNNGQTPGKMVMGIRVIKADGTPIEDIDAVLRYLGYLINSPFLFIGWLWAFIDPNRQGWHDKLARTYVVVAGEEAESVVSVTSKRKNNVV